MNLKQFQEENPDLWPAVKTWVLEGWGVSEDVEISPFMVAAALEKEATTQDECVREGTSHPSFPVRLRQYAINLAVEEAERLSQDNTSRYRELHPAEFRSDAIAFGGSSVILAVQDFKIIGCLDPAKYEGAEANWPHGWAELIALSNLFDQIDVELPSKAMLEAYIEHFKPGDVETSDDDTLSWDDVEGRITECLHKIDGEALAEVHNTVCPTCPGVRYIGDSMFELADGTTGDV